MSRTVKPAVHSSSGAISISWRMDDVMQFLGFTMHLSAIPTTSEDITLTLNPAGGDPYTTVLYRDDPSRSRAVDYWVYPETVIRWQNGDQLVLAYANTDGNTIGAQIYFDHNPHQ